jgi:hypothetical protein
MYEISSSIPVFLCGPIISLISKKNRTTHQPQVLLHWGSDHGSNMNSPVGFRSVIRYRRNYLVMSGMVIPSDLFLVFKSWEKSPLETENEDRDVEISLK